MSRFEHISFYDAPSVTLTQAFNGSLTLQSTLDTWLNNGGSLAPMQRADYRKAFENATGNSRIGNAVVGIATNPFVWLGFLLTPRVGGALVKGVGSAAEMSRAKLFGGYMGRSILPAWARTGVELADGTPAMAAAMGATEHINDLHLRYTQLIEPAERKVIGEIFGVAPEKVTREQVHIFNVAPEKAPTPEIRDKIERFWVATYDHQAGIDMDYTRARVELVGTPTYVDPNGDRVPIPEIDRPAVFASWKKNIRKREQKLDFTVFDEASQQMRRYDNVEIGGTPFMQKVGFSKQPNMVAHLAPMRVLQEIGPAAVEFQEQIARANRRRLGMLMFKGVDRETPDGAIDQIMDPLVDADSEVIRNAIDTDKIERLWASAMRGDRDGLSTFADGMVESLFSPEVVRRMRKSWQSQAYDLDLGEFRSGMRNTEPKRPFGYLPESERMNLEQFKEALAIGAATNVRFDRYMPRTSTHMYTPTRRRTGEVDYRKTTIEEMGGIREGVAGASGRSRPVTEAPVFDIEDINLRKRVYGPENVDKDGAFETAFNEAIEESLKYKYSPVPVTRMDFREALSRYEQQTARDVAFYVSDADLATKDEMHRIFRSGPQAKYWASEHRATDSIRPLPSAASQPGGHLLDRRLIRDLSEGGKKFVSYADIFDQAHAMIDKFDYDMAVLHGGLSKKGSFESKNARMWREVIVPAVMGYKNEQVTASKGAILMGQSLARKFTSSALGRKLFENESMAPLKSMLDKLADLDPIVDGRRTDASLASYLYSTHLGYNLGSVVLNLTQPFLHAATYGGIDNVLKAYPRAIRDMSNYVKLRWSRPEWQKLNISGEQRREIAKAAGMEWVDETGIMGNMLEDIDRLTYQQGYRKQAGKFGYFFQELPMKAFEKGEWLNRLVTAHMVASRFEAQGLTKVVNGARTYTSESVRAAMSDEMKRAVLQFQFGADIMNTPSLFMKNRFLSNPLLRQFLTFMIRTPSTVFEMAGKMSGREDLAQAGSARLLFEGLKDFGRMAGLSAVLYETGKAMYLDTARGGIAQAVGDVIGGDSLLEGDAYQNPSLPYIPPSISIPLDFAKGFLQSDADVLGNAVSRLIPGGIAISRALGSAPRMDGGLANTALAGLPALMQRNYVDYANPLPDGRVPYFRGDGSLVDYRPPMQLMMRALGVPLESHKNANDFDRWLAKSRDKIIQVRSRFLDAVMNNEHRKAAAIRAEFQKEFGIPLTVTRQQLKARATTRTVPRFERMLERLPSDIRQQFMEAASTQEYRGQITHEQLLEGLTTTQRGARPVPGDGSMKLDERTAKLLEQAASDDRDRQAILEGQFTPYRSY